MSEEVTTLVISYLNGTCTKEDETRINKWLKENIENKRTFDEICDIWYATILADKSLKYDAIQGLKTVRSRIKQAAEKKSKTDHGKRTITYQLLRIAAIFVIAFVSGISSMLLLNKPTVRNNELTAITAPIGSQTTMTLPDGTRIWLNAGSTLTYTGKFNRKDREVNLKGEAYFDVAKNPKIPFIVDAENVKIKAIGTAFNVKAYPEEKRVETTLVRGLVEIERTGLTNRILLKPNQKIVFFSADANTQARQAKTAAQKRTAQSEVMAGKEVILDKGVDTEKEVCWKEGKLIFDREPLKDLVIRLERKYNVHFTFTSEKLKNYKYTGTFEDVSLEQIMAAMKLSSPVDYIIKDKEVKLMEKPSYLY